MKYSSTQNSPAYYPPILGNGDIAFSTDWEGTFWRPCPKGMTASRGTVFRAGRRLAKTFDGIPQRILSFGSLRFFEGSEPVEWTQELCPEEGLLIGECRYADGAEIRTESRLLQDGNLYFMKKSFRKLPGGAAAMKLVYTLEGYSDFSDRALTVLGSSADGRIAKLAYTAEGLDTYRGEVCLAGSEGRTEAAGNTLTLAFDAREGCSIECFFCLEDDLFEKEPEKKNAELLALAETLGYDGLARRHGSDMRGYFSCGYIETPDKTLNTIFRTALYDLKCYTTRWSVPVGISDVTWDGKFFAFDEYYSFLGLLLSGRGTLAKRVPAFRSTVCLDKAVTRATHLTDEQVRLPWETNEYGDECSRPGFWYEHVFHMSIAGLGAYQYYLYSRDEDFLRSCYRLIRGCAKFFTLHMLYRDGDTGRVYLGKCTDLERLGSSVENAFMSQCGAIAVLEALAGAAEVLGVDEAYRAECRELAGKLRESLPTDGEKYVPYHGTQKSIAVFAGKFPFDVLPGDDERLLAAWKDFIRNEREYGNMYKGGERTSAWYACWKAAGYARCGMQKEAYASLRQCFEEAGVFGELFEINEPGIMMRPWFTTAAGIFLSTVCEMLIQSDEGKIVLLPAFPHGGSGSETDEFRLKLAVRGGICEAHVIGNRVESCRVTDDAGKDITESYDIRLAQG